MPLRFFNDTDQEHTITARELRTGRDGESVTVQPGEQGHIEIDGDYQLIVSTGARPSDQAPMEMPVATIEAPEFEGGDDTLTEGADSTISGGEGNDVITGGAQLTEAPDAVVQNEIAAMVADGKNLTRQGKPELPVLNERLAAKGFLPVNGERRDSLSAA